MIESKVLIVMPAYNCENTIKATLMSIIHQTYSNFNLVIVNDCSTDNTILKIIEILNDLNSHNNEKITVYTNDYNIGVSESRNIALKIGKYELYDFIAFCDSDDVWENDHLQKQINFIDNKYDIVCSTPKCVDMDHRVVYLYGGINYRDISRTNLLRFNRVYISSVLTTRSVIAEVGKFDCTFDGVEDWDYWIRVLNAGFKFGMNEENTITYLVKNVGMAAISKEKQDLFRRKYPIKLNLGCGTEHLNDYLNCDLYAPGADLKFDAAKIEMNDCTVDEIRAYHLIEHFDFHAIFKVLQEWYRVLKSGGTLVLETPDLLNSCKRFVEANNDLRQKLYGHFFAWPWLDGQTHRFLFTEDQLRWTLEKCGFINIQRVAADSIYAKCNSDISDIYLKVIARKK